MNRKHLLSIFAPLLLVACTYDAPLAPNAELPLDQALLGNWLMLDEEGLSDGTETMTVRRSDEQHYAIEHHDGDSVIYFNGWLAELEGIRFLQLEVTGDENGPAEANEPNRYSVISYHFEDEELVIHSLNTELVGPHDASTAALREAFGRHHEDPLLFIEPGRMRRQ